MTRTLRLEPLTAEAFAPFGDVVGAIEPGGGAKLSETLVALPGAATPRLGFNNAKAWDLPLTATEMERHNLSSQCFVPLDVSRWVMVVAPDLDGRPDPAALRAFVATGDQAVNYHVGTWHHPLRVLDRPGRFAVLMWTTGHKPDDEEWSTLPEPLQIEA
ncbi:ureidoglycolate lyase [Humitalea rosea]|uniref:Ureidoglycolate lyase n=1 Tax=Humitalea rosea TaxID=990373 RepID=A0A2W7HXZ5_9PROT|nr:ureidoglycolate lyase [Humitalea rosea]PZW39446.1 ureidoglycolate lyase [Humitalea rosea]